MTNKKKSSLLKYTCKLSLFEILRRFFVCWFFMFFCALIITQQESFLIKTSLLPNTSVFVLEWTPEDWWFDSTLWHWSASEWDYLFQESSSSSSWSSSQEPVYVAQPKDFIDDGVIPNISSTWNISVSTWKNTTSTFTAAIATGFTTWINLLTWNLTWFVDTPDLTWWNSCITPWWERLAHKDFVLAYEQRKDVSNLCNVQKRYCFNWKLTWSYPQKSCKEHTLYSYIKPEPVSYVEETKNPYVQPNKPSLSWADFDIHGHIDWSTTPIDVWWNDGLLQPSSSSSLHQTSTKQKWCVTPWWKSIPNGQFVKAYKSSLGLLDVPCDVELRLCVLWNLKWSYSYRTCTFKKMTYRDYMVDNYNLESTTTSDLMNTLQTEEKETVYKNSSFWKWLDKYF